MKPVRAGNVVLKVVTTLNQQVAEICEAFVRVSIETSENKEREKPPQWRRPGSGWSENGGGGVGGCLSAPV